MKHECTAPSPNEDTSNGYGPAVDVCYERPDGTFRLSNGEYSSRVNYCPYCGTKAPTQIVNNARTAADRRAYRTIMKVFARDFYAVSDQEQAKRHAYLNALLQHDNKAASFPTFKEWSENRNDLNTLSH
jgi:hypothetical protein